MTVKTSWLQKIALISFGIILTFFVLEILLRVAGISYLLIQNHVPQRNERKSSLYTIVCLGESTTMMGEDLAYPRQLESILNARSPRIKFKVINKGVASIETDGILSELEGNLKNHHPDMVVVMMGINDTPDTQVFQDSLSYRLRIFFGDLRFIKIVKLAWKTGFFKVNEWRAMRAVNSACAKDEVSSLEKQYESEMMLNRRDAWGYIELGRYYESHQRIAAAERVYWQAVMASPRDDWAYRLLVKNLIEQNKIAKAQKLLDWMFAIRSNKIKPWAFRLYGEFYQQTGRLTEAKAMFEKGREISERDDDRYDSWYALGKFYADQKLYTEAITHFKKALELKRNDAEKTHLQIAACYRALSQDKEAFDFLAQEVVKNGNYLEPFADWYYKQNELERVKALILYSEQQSGKQPFNQKELERFNRRQGRDERDASSDNNETIDDLYLRHPATEANYRKLAKTLHDKSIKLVAVQYPVLSPLQLKKILEGEDVFAFVDNEKVFKNALRDSSSQEYFSDKFAHVFGHASPKGNRLLADNVARVILNSLNISEENSSP